MNAPNDDRNLPDVHLGLYDDVIVFDHVEKVLMIKDLSNSKILALCFFFMWVNLIFFILCRVLNQFISQKCTHFI